jgi:transcriptional regulator with XRE-family HTH domain
MKLEIQEKLRDLREEKKLILEKLSEATKISVPTLQRMENNDDYHASYQDIKTLADFYEVSTDYLVGKTESREYGTARIDELNLTNDAIDVLKSGRLNNYLVSELLAHPDFQQLLTAVEIYIDRKVLPQMSTVNAMYKFAEKTLTDNFKVSSRDEVVAFLRQSVIDEDEYLLYRISERFNVIMKSLFDKHEKLAPPAENPIVTEFEKDMQYYLDNRDNPARAKLTLLAKQIGLNLKHLTDEQIMILMKALESSALYKKSARRR